MANGMPYDSDEGRGGRRGDHGADDRPRLPAVGRSRRRARAPTSVTPRTVRTTTRCCEMHRGASHEIPDADCRDNELLAAARAVVGRGRRTRPALRLPQRPGDGARADGDDLVPDGLRHDRRRARLLAREVQGARRRRPDDDRQPHRATGAPDARLHAPRRSSRSTRTSPSTARSSAHPGSPRSTCRCSTSRSASGRSRTWATSR